MIYIAGKPECTKRELARADRARRCLSASIKQNVRLGYAEGGVPEARHSFMQMAYDSIAEADTVVFLRGWRRSRAIQIQHMYCKFTGKRVLYFKEGIRGAILEIPKSEKRRKNNGEQRNQKDRNT